MSPRILIIKMSSMGDVVHAMPALCALREQFPGSEIAWLVDERFAALVRQHPAADCMIQATAPGFTDRLYAGDTLRSVFHAKVIGELRRLAFDWAIDLQGIFRTGLLSLASGARVRIGFAEAREGAAHFYSHRVSAPRDLHAVERCLRIARFLGAGNHSVRFDLPIEQASRVRSARMLAQAGFGADEQFVIIAPRSSRSDKDWKVEGFAAVARYIWTRFRLRSVLVGGDRDSAVCRNVAAASGSPAICIAGQSLALCIALIERSRLVIGNDSGPLHIAAALGRDLIGLYGPTDPSSTGPWSCSDCIVRRNDTCRACHLAAQTPRTLWQRISRLGSPPHSCLTTLRAEHVVQLVDRQLMQDSSELAASQTQPGDSTTGRSLAA